MPFREWLFRINDILDAVSAINQYVAGMTYKDFLADRKTIDAVIRNLIIIGEAASHIPEEIARTHPEVPWIDMKAIFVPSKMILFREEDVSVSPQDS